MNLPYLSEERIHAFIVNALNEDIGNGDHSSLGSISENQISNAQLIIKGEGILAGMDLARKIFLHIDPHFELDILLKDGDKVKFGEIGFHIHGKSRAILAGERLALNCLQRMSGIATYTHQLSDMIRGTGAKLLDTRKTTPNFRLAEKWAVAIGGGVNHRFGLYDMVMLKDNHIDYAGGVRQAIESSVAYLKEKKIDLKIEVEVRNLRELQEVIDTGGVFRVLLDNMLPSSIRQAIGLVDGKMETEASGGITENNIREIAETGVNYISVGALTHSYKSIDISLKAE
ncbi:MAG: nicotinate-nucleotide pyrophosphorylase (carboxylating) [Cyclobacteriaceae bacterium]|jgi:nicotinate-nucleotide pyrophosphorylase (carboxylating)